MLDANRKEFKGHLQDLMRSYPSFRRSRPEMIRTMRTYFRKLKRYSLPAVVDAIDSATDYHPEKFPSVGQLTSIIRKIGSEQDAQSKRTTRSEMTEVERSIAASERDQLPRDPQAQSSYVSAAETEAERVARMWEVEDLTSSRQPWDDTPPAVARSRFVAIRALLKPIHDRSVELAG